MYLVDWLNIFKVGRNDNVCSPADDLLVRREAGVPLRERDVREFERDRLPKMWKIEIEL